MSGLNFNFKALIFMCFLIFCREALAADISVNSHFGIGSSNFSRSSSSYGYSAQISQSFWIIKDWDLSPTLSIGRDHFLGSSQEGSRKRLDTVDTYHFLPGMSLGRALGNQRLTLTILSGPVQADLRINDSTPQSATIYDLDSIRGWQNLAAAKYHYQIGNGVNVFSGISWRQQDLQVGQSELRFQSQDLSTGLLSLTDGISVPSAFDLPETIRSRAFSLELGVSIEL